MKNKSAAVTQNTLLYTKAFRQIAGSVTSTILFQRLEFRFSKYPEGFYKFMEPAPNNKRYKRGDSWCEELSFSKEEFRTAFDAIGIRYRSRGEYESAEHKFRRADGSEALYCSFIDKSTGLTFYYRNDELVDRKLDEITHGAGGQSQSGQVGNANLAGGQSQSGQMGNANLHHVYHDGTCTDGTHTEGASAPQGVGEQSPPGKILSRHDLDTIRAYIEHKQATEGGINSAEAVAKARYRDGLDDALIDAWLDEREERKRVDAGGAQQQAARTLPGEPDEPLRANLFSSIEQKVNPLPFQTWFKPTGPLCRDGPVLYWVVPDKVFQDWITINYSDVLEEALAEIGLSECKIEFICGG